MHRFTLVIAFTTAVFAVGCAAGEEDPQPVETVEPQHSPPAQIKSGEQKNPLGDIAGTVDEVRTDLELSPRQPLPIPNGTR